MKTKHIRVIASIVFALTITMFYSSCKKKEDEKPKNANSAADNSNADNAFAGIWKQISTVTDSSNNLRSMATSCASATIVPFDAVTWPKTVTINFGTTNCMGSDGNNRRGVITAVFTGPYLDSNSVITVTLTNYYHNDYHVEGTQTIKNMGHNSAGHLVYNVVVSGATITHPTNGTHSTWSTNQNREFYAGYTTNFNIFDDVYLITGTANGVSAEGEAYNIVVNSALQVNVGCPWIVKGNFTLTLTSYPSYPIVFDYGTGACDGDATALFDGTTYAIYMH